MAETILLVDDEEPVRKTFQEWLAASGWECRILTAADAETALNLANRQPIDLAILDWNLGAGDNGLQLLEDLYVFNPDIVAIMVTGYAHQATPLDAMRMGVRDYLDKSHDLNRETFLSAVRRQLDKIGPAKRERELQRSLRAFHDSVEKILPLVRTAAAMNDPVPFTESVRHLFRFLLQTTGASDGLLLVRSYDRHRQPPEVYRAYNIQGEPLQVELLPFPQSLASAVASMQEVCLLNDLRQASASHGVALQAFERNHKNLLAAALPVGAGTTVVLELFDKRGDDGFSDADRRIVAAAADFGTEMLKQALAERQTQGVLLAGLEAALQASQQALQTRAAEPLTRPEQPLAPPVMDRLRKSLAQAPVGTLEADQSLKLAELLRVIALRHGREATEYCIHLLEGVDRLLRAVTGEEAGR